jgi:hypothetical protein
MPDGPRTRRSHVVPRFYLAGFSEPGTERVWVGDIKTQKCYPAHIAKIGVAKDFYAAQDGGHEDDLETHLSKIESNAAPDLKWFVGGGVEISPDLGRFIAWLAARTTWLRRITEATLPDFIRANERSLRDVVGSEKRLFEFEEISSGKRERISLQDTLERINNRNWRLRVSQDQHLDVIRLQAYLFQTQHFSNINWVKATAPSGYSFATSDKPVCWDVLGSGVGDWPAALRHPAAELTVPLDAGHALIANHDPSYILAHPLSVAEINERTAIGAERFLYGASEKGISNLLRFRLSLRQ